LTNARLIVAGGKPDRTIQRIVDETNSEVTFLGHVSDVGRLMRACDVFLHPTRWDTCSLVTSEAMASGLPVITSGMNGAAELISDGYDGLVCSDPEKIDVIADTMARLMDPALRRTIGDNAKRRIGTFDIRRTALRSNIIFLSLRSGLVDSASHPAARASCCRWPDRARLRFVAVLGLSARSGLVVARSLS
jgi:glycosyltransferase involved in cell wall biosynthesis